MALPHNNLVEQCHILARRVLCRRSVRVGNVKQMGGDMEEFHLDESISTQDSAEATRLCHVT